MIMHFIAKLMFENKTPMASHRSALEQSGQKLLAKYAAAGDTPTARKQLLHIVAIERWGIGRLQMLLGQKPFEADSSKAYQLPDNTSWSALLEALSSTRQQLLALTPALDQTTVKVLHNSFGEISARAWLKYLNFHANAETSRVKPAR